MKSDESDASKSVDRTIGELVDISHALNDVIGRLVDMQYSAHMARAPKE
jgi:hypothetical protein